MMVCGGRMRHGDLALSGPTAVEFVSDVFVEVAFLGSGEKSTGINARRSLMSPLT